MNNKEPDHICNYIQKRLTETKTEGEQLKEQLNNLESFYVDIIHELKEKCEEWSNYCEELKDEHKKEIEELNKTIEQQQEDVHNYQNILSKRIN